MQLIFIVSLVATLGSLYFSEIRDYTPCEFCWYQRILMYPIIIISFISNVKDDCNARLYIRIMAIIGFLIGLYHYGLQKLDFLKENLNACTDGTCAGIFINWFGFVTIPFLSLTAFFIIIVLSILIKKGNQNE
ncbi:disulfide oxidoreductase [Phocicoccus pinnipedialis]|nr:disulfide oxidoreductase [Jeotgalicoccus pinnipedialis]